MSDPPSPNKGLLRTVVDGFAWSSLTSIAGSAVKVVSLVVLARLLTREDFGVAAAAAAFVGIAGLLAELGVGSALVQLREATVETRSTALFLALGAGAVLGVGLFVGAPALARAMEMPSLDGPLRLLAFLPLAAAAASVQRGLLQRALEFRALALVEILSFGAAHALLAVGLASLGFGYWSLVIAYLAKPVLEVLLQQAVLEAGSFRIAFRWSEVRSLVGFGTGLTVQRLADMLARQVDNLIIGRQLGAEPLGVYTRAYQLLGMPATLLGQAGARVLFPAFASIQDQGARIARSYRRGVAALAIAVLPFSVLTGVLAPEIVRVFLGPGWEDAVRPLEFLAFGMYFRTSSGVSQSLARAMGAVWPAAWRQGVFALGVVLAASIGWRWGIDGVSAGVVLAFALQFLLLSDLALRVTELDLASLVSAHGPGAVQALVALAIALPVAGWLRSLELAAFWTAAATSVTTVLGLALFSAALPRLGLGPDGAWVIGLIRKRLPGRMRDRGADGRGDD